MRLQRLEPYRPGSNCARERQVEKVKSSWEDSSLVLTGASWPSSHSMLRLGPPSYRLCVASNPHHSQTESCSMERGVAE